MKLNTRVISILTFSCCLALFPVSSQATRLDQDPPLNQDPVAVQPDLVEQLHLTPDQRQRIRAIREDSKNERAGANQRLKDSNAALQLALDSDNLDEGLIEQRIRDVNSAQLAQMRMRIQTEVRIRRVLTPEQLATWRALRLQVRDLLQNSPRRRQIQGLRPNPRNSNGVAPQLPRRNVPPRTPH